MRSCVIGIAGSSLTSGSLVAASAHVSLFEVVAKTMHTVIAQSPVAAAQSFLRLLGALLKSGERARSRARSSP